MAVTTRRPLLIAHRGASVEQLENSLDAYRLARDLGVDQIELDVHLTRDDIVVVHHDYDLARSAGDARSIADLSLDELKQITLRYGRDDRACTIPSLAEVFTTIDLPIAIELKGSSDAPDQIDALTDHVLDLLDELPHARDRASLLSFERRALERARTRFPRERVALVRNREYGDEGWKEGLEVDCGIVVLSRTIATPAIVDALHHGGKKVWIYSLDVADDVRQWCDAGIDGILSNDPRVARTGWPDASSH